MSVNIQNFREAVFGWADGETDSNTAVIWSRPNENRPPVPYVTLNFLTGPVRMGGRAEEVIKSDGSTSVRNRYMMTLSVIVYDNDRFNTMQLAADLQASLSSPLVLEALRKKDIAVFNEGPILDVSALLESGFEERAQMDVVFGLCGEDIIATEPIEEVELSGTVNEGPGHPGEIVVPETIISV